MSSSNSNDPITKSDALKFHAEGRPGKLEITATKPVATQRDLSLAYSPGVAEPCLEIEKDPETAYDYTAKANTVAVISNGTAVLGLGNLGALASKPVMEGKAVLFKRFADIDGIDIELASEDVDEFVRAVELIAPTFGGINLEDIKAPESFIIEERLKESCDIPVMHDDQHGTAIIAAAGVLNSLKLVGKRKEDVRLVVNGAGAAALASVNLLTAMGFPSANIIMADSKGVLYRGRQEGMNQWKSAVAVETKLRTLEEAMVGADIFFGLSVKGAVSAQMVRSMADNPIIFAMANPDPEILPEEVRAVRDDAIMATGRSDYPNQVNNVLGFPYIFRGALDVRASAINDTMKIAAVEALADLAREEVPAEVGRAYGRQLTFGRDYIIPAPFDPRLIHAVPLAVAKAAMASGVARKPIADLDAYEAELKGRLDPSYANVQRLYGRIQNKGYRYVFAEGEDERAIRAALEIKNSDLGHPILVGKREVIEAQLESMGLGQEKLDIRSAKTTVELNQRFAENLFQRKQREGMLRRDAARHVNQNRNIFAASLLTDGHADTLITGLTRSFASCLEDLRLVVKGREDERLMTYSWLSRRGESLFVADTSVHEDPTAEQLAAIAKQTAATARRLGSTPRVAFVSYGTFGQPRSPESKKIQRAISILEADNVDFEFEGEMAVNIALDHQLMKSTYPFARLTGPANVLIMPTLTAANISYKLLTHYAEGLLISPILQGFDKPCQIVSLSASVQDVVNSAVIAAIQVELRRSI